MKRFMYKLKRMPLIALGFALFSSTANATVYTAVASGNFSSAATWGGIVPAGLLTSDVVIIPSGINVTLTSIETISGTTSLTVNGTLSAATSAAPLILTSGTLAGAGTISVDSMVLGLTSGFTFTGSLISHRLTSTGAAIATAANVTVNNSLYLTSGTLTMAAGTLTMGNYSHIVSSGGSIATSGTGMLALDSVYDVTYTAASAMAGLELTGTGLNNLTVASAGTVTLAASTVVKGVLTLTSGNLALNGQTLTISPTGSISSAGTGMIMSTLSSNIVINTASSTANTLRFAAGGNTLNNLTLNTGGATSLASDLNANGIVTLTAGALALNGHTLTFNNTGNLSGAGTGTITGDALANVVVNSTAGLTGALRFTTGSNMLNNLTVNTGAASVVSLGSDLVVNGTATLTSGVLALNGRTLTFNTPGNLSAAGTGTIMGSATSSMVINSTAGLTGTLRFATGGNMLNNLTVNTGAASSTFLGSDLTVNGLATLTSGTLALNGYDLVFTTGSNLAAAGTGTITGNISSDVVVNAATGLTGALRFAAAANTINNLVVNTGGAVTLGTDLIANGAVTLTTGTLALAGHTLTFNPAGNFSAAGTGTITGDAMANIVVNSTAGLTGALRFTTGSNMLNNININTATGSVVSLGSDLVVNGTATLTSGMLALNGRTLTFGTAGNLASAGTGTIMGSTTSSMIINSTAGLTGMLRFAAGGNMLNNLTVNTGAAASTFLGSDLTINGLATLTSGTLALNGYDLVFATSSNLAAAGTGTITGNAASDVVINSTTGLTGSLRFATAANTINNLVVNTGGVVTLGSDMAANGMVTLTAGTLALAGHTLTLNPTGNIATAGTGTITGDAMANMVINSTAGLTGTLRFTTGSNMLNNLTVNTATGSVVALGSDLATSGLVTLTNGVLSLNGHTLTFNGASNLAASGAGTMMGSVTSNMVINSTAGLTGALRFATGGNMLNNFSLNTATGSVVTLGSDLVIDGTATLTAGSLALNGYDLTFNTASNLASTGAGTITGNTASDVIVNSAAGLTGTLRFAIGANTINNLTFNTGSVSNVSLGSDLNVNGLVTLSNGTLSLNGHSLTLTNTGNLSASGTGSIIGSTTSDIIVNTTGSLGGPIRFATGGNVLNNLTVNTGTGGNVSLISDLNVNGVLNLTSGTLWLNGNTLTLNAASNVAAAGSGVIMGSNTSNIIINSTAGLTGSLRFASAGNMLHDLTVNTGAGSSATIGSDLVVSNTLKLMSGKLKLDANNLIIPAGATVTGGSASSYVLTSGAGKLVKSLAAGATSTFEVGTITNYAPMAITANSGSASGDVSINVADGVLSGGTSGTLLSATQAVVNATWFVSSSAAAGVNYNMTAMWNAGMEVNSFNRAKAYISHYTSGAWDVQTASAAGTSGSMYTMTRTGITSLSPFMVAQEAAATFVPVVTVTQPAIHVYPNPTTGILHFTATAGIESVTICDMVGKCIQSIQVLNDAIDVSTLPAGNYVIHFIGKDVNVAQQFEKQ